MKKIIRLVLFALILMGIVSGMAQAQIGPTDSFGYNWADSKSPSPAATFNWLDISSTGTNAGINCDDCYSGPKPIGFDFNYYGNRYSSVYLGSNGYLTFSGGSGAYGNSQIPSSSAPSTMVAPFWDDLYVAYGGRVLYQTIGTAPNRIFIAQWQDIRYCCSDYGRLNFQILLYEQSNSIVYQYNSMTDGGGGRAAGNSATIGIQGPSSTQGLQYSLNNATVSQGLAIVFSRLILNVGTTLPAGNAQAVNLNATIRATVNQQLNSTTVNSSAMTVTGSQSGTISGAVNYLPLLGSLEFKPSASFAPGETITVTINTSIRGVNGAVLQSPYSWSFVAGNVADNDPPPAITSLAAQDVAHDAGGQVQLSWAPNPASDLGYYRVYRDTAPINSISALQPLYVTSLNSHRDATTSDGVDFYYAVTAVDNSGNESALSVAGPVQSINDPPLSPSGLSGNISTNGLNLYWNANSDADFTGYKLYFGTQTGVYGVPVDLGNRTSYELTGVQPCTQYHVALTAYDAAGNESPYSGELTINSGSPGSPTASQGLTATATNGAIQLNWTSNPECDIDSYYVYRSTVSGSGYQYYTRVYGTSYRDVAIANGTTYYYKIAAIDSFSLVGTTSAEVSATAIDSIPPNQSYSLSGSPGYSGINLQWYGNNSGVGDLAGYKIYYGTSSGNYGQPVQVPTNYGYWNSYALSGLTDCTDYHIAVSAYDLSGNESQRSSELVYNSGQAGSPVAPTGVLAISEESKITVTWNSNPECDIQDYYVYRSVGNNTNWQYVTTMASTSYVDGRIANGTTYFYRIIARDRAGYTSPSSTDVSAVAINTAAPQAPPAFYVSAYAGATYLYLSWNSNPEPDIASYKVYYGTSSGSYTQTVSTGSTYAYLNDLQACTPYFLAISAVDLSGNESSLSPQQTSYVSGSASMQPPSGLVVSSTESQISLSWNANPECDVYGYRIYRSTTSGIGYQELSFVPASTTTFDDRTIANGTRYYYTVKAFNYASVSSQYSGEVSAIAVDTTPPQPPAWLNATSGDNFIDVNWGASPSVDVKNYLVYYGTQPGVYGTPLTTTGSSRHLADLNACSTYYIQVKAVDQSNLESRGTQEVSARANIPGVPSAPAGLTGEGGSNAAALRWTPNPECDVKEYQIYRSTSSGGVYQHVGNVTGVTYTDQNLQSETEYFYVVKAIDYSGLVSNPSLEIRVVTRDTTPPILPVVDPLLSLLTASPTYVLRGTKEANSSILINGSVVVPLNNSTTWEATVTLADVHNNFAITSKDSSGNECLPVRIDVVKDVQPPQLSTSTPANGYLTNLSISQVTLTLADPLSGVNINQSLVGATVKNQQQDTIAGQWTTLDSDKLVFRPLLPMLEGVYTVTVSPVDGLGNVGAGTVSITFAIDQTPPPVPVVTTYLPLSNMPTQTIAGTRSSDVAAVVVTLNGNLLPQNRITYPGPTSWQASVTGFTEGVNVIVVNGKDAAGNQSDGATISPIYDTTAPTAPSVGTFAPVTRDSSLTLTGTKEANSYLYLNNVKVSVPFAGADWSYTVSLMEGANSFSFFSKDEAGNSGPSTAVAVTRDTTPPRILSSTPTASSYTNQAGTLEVTLTDNGSTPDLAASFSGAVVENAAGSLVNGSWGVVGGAIVFTPSDALPDGKYKVTIYPVDTLGNKGSASFSFTLDGASPTVKGFTLSPASPVKAGTATFTLAFSEAMLTSVQPVVTFTRGLFYSTYTLVGSWLDNKTWRGSYALTADTGDGTYTVSTSGAKDLAGNIMASQAAGNFTLMTATPGAPTVEPVKTPTKTVNQILTGTKPANTAIVINNSVRITLDGGTNWSYSYPLAEGANTLAILARDAAGNDSLPISPAPVITLDTTPPLFSVDVYKNPAPTATQTISGKKEPGSIVTLKNGTNVTTIFDATDQGATWSYPVTVTDGINNRLVFTAADAIGNVTTKTIDILCDTVPPQPLASGMLVIDGSGKGTEVTLSWPSYVELADLAYYRVYFNGADFTDTSALTAVGTANKGSKTFKATGLIQGTRYYFAVVPVGISGNADPKVYTAQGVPTDTLPPEDVTGLIASAAYSVADGNAVSLTWTGSKNSTGDLTDQIIYMDAGQGYDAGAAVGKTATTYARKGLNDATLYKFKVTTKDTLGHESAGSVVTAVTRLANPAGLAATPGSQKATITWNAVNSPYVKSYNIYRLQSDVPQTDATSMTLVKSQTGTSFTDTGLTNGLTYQYAVTTLNTSGAERTTVQSIGTAPRGDTTGPVIVGLNVTKNQVITAPISISASAQDAESAMGKMELWIDNVITATANGGSLSYPWNVVNAADGNHSVKLVAYDVPGNSTESIVPVVVSLAPPAVPTITSTFSGPINVKTATITGTAQQGSTVSLRVNGVVVAQQVAANSTFTFASVAMGEGDNFVAAKAGNRGGDSPFTAETKITVITTAPSAPVNLATKVLAGGSIQFAWQTGISGAPSGYNLYEVPASFIALTDPGVRKTNSSLIPFIIKEYIPADDNLRRYVVTAVDGAGNESPPSNVVAVASDRQAPTVGAITFTDGTGSIPADNIYGPGTVQVAITVSEALSEVPFCSLEPQNASPIVVNLRKIDETHYAGSITIDSTSPFGPTTWKFSGKDVVGNRGNRQGTGIIIDVKGPAATIAAPAALLKTADGPAVVSFSLDERSLSMPSLTLRAADGGTAQATGLASTDNGLTWSGSLDPAGLGEGQAQFTLSGAQDRFGNKNNAIKSGASILLYKNTPPAPAVPAGLSAKPAKGGKISLSWSRVADAQGYKVYRQITGDAAPLAITEIGAGTTVTYTDTPAADGSYLYSISSVGLLNAESARSAEVTAVSDRTSPAAPTGLALTMTGNGIQATWQGVQTAGDVNVEVPAAYRLYRNDGVIADVAGLTPVATVTALTATDPAPTAAKRFYTVVALDSLGNESAPSASQEIVFPVAPVANLNLAVVDDGKPFLSWTSAEANVQGFYIYRNGAKINEIPTISTTYNDGYYAGGSVTYGVSAVDASGTESPVKEASLPVISFGLKDGTAMHRGLLETVSLVAALPADAAGSVTIDEVSIQIGTLPASVQAGPFTVAPGSPLEIKKVAATEATAPPQEAVVTSAVMHPAPGTTVKLTRTSLASVLGSGTALEIFNEPLVRGTMADVRIRVNNLGSARTEFITSENGGPTSHVTVYLKDQDGNILSQGKLDQRTGNVVNSGSYATARLEPGESFLSDPISIAVPAGAPFKVSLVAVIDATYYHYNQVDQVLAPGLKQAVDATIADVSYMATAITDKAVYKQGEKVVISGNAISTATNGVMPLVPVKIGISVNGFDRFFTVNTDANGAFSYTFTPASNEAGSYSVWAAHPDLTGRSIQARFSIIGLAVSPTIANVTILKGKYVDIPVTLANLGTALTGLSLTPSASNGLSAVVVNGGADNLAAGERRTVAFRLTADAGAPALGFASLAIATAEGLSERVEANVSAVSAIPLIVTAPSYVDTGIVRGSQRIESFSITNTGLGSLDNARIDGPSLPWLSLTVDRNLGNIPPGQRNNIGILMQPADTVPQGIYNDRIVIYSDNHIPYTYNIQVTVTSSAVGGVQFSLLDELMKQVGGGTITLQHQTLPDLYYTLTTAADGTVSLFDIPEGRYTYNVSASGHKPYSSSFVITPGVTTTVPVGLEVTLVQVEWSVTPVTIEDRYQITVSQTFATNVPTAVIVTEPPNINLQVLQPGQVFNGEFTITNYGLAAADYKGLSFPVSTDEYDVEVFATMPSRLAAMQKITVPYRITRRSQAASTGVNSAAAITSEVKSYGGGCSGSITFTSTWSYVICPGALNERTVTMTSTSSASWNTCTTSGGSASGTVSGGGVWYGGGTGTGGGASSGGATPPGTATITSLGGDADDSACIYPRRPNDCPDCDTSVATGSSVDVGNGTYLFSETDLRVPARAIPIDFSRTYRSNQIMKGQDDKAWNFTTPMDSPLGFGWYSPWFVRVGADGTFIDGAGNYIAFAKDANGAFLPNTRNGLTLSKTPVGFELRKKGENTMIFDADGWLRKIKDGAGNLVSLTYGTNGKLATVIDTAGRTVLTFAYNTDGRVQSITDIASRMLTYEYDAIGNMTKVSLTSGGKTVVLNSYGYDMIDYGRIPMKCDYSTTTSGTTTTTVVKCYTDQLKPEDQFGTYCKYKEWFVDGVKYSQGYCVEPQYQNNYHNMISRTNVAGETYTYDYQPKWRNKGIIRSITDPSGRTMTFNYSFTSGVFFYTDYSGRKFKKVMNEDGKLVYQAEILPDGKEEVIKTITYLDGRVQVVTDAAGNKTTEQKDEWENVIRRVDGEGNEWRYVYTPEGKLMSTTNPLGTINRYEYDAAGNRTKETLAAGTDDESITTNTFNKYSQLTSTTRGETATTYGYDDAGNLTTVTDAMDNSTTMTYDLAGNLTGRTTPLIGTTTYETHDYKGNPGKVTDPNGNIITYTYDDAGRVLTITNGADNGVTTYTYVSNTGTCTSGCSGGGSGKIASVTLPEGNKVSYDYNPDGNLAKIIDNDGNYIAYSYDGKGNKTRDEIHDKDGVLQKYLSYQYDVLNRLKKTVNPDDSFTEQGYDKRGNRVSLTNPNGNTTAYAYDAANRLIKVIQPGNAVTGYTYDRRNNLTTVTDANGNTTSYEYDKLNRLTKTISPDTGITTYTYDKNGNLRTKTDAKGVIGAYVYDANKRLTSLSYPNSKDNVSYIYDTCINGKGHICSMIDASGMTSYVYTKRGQLSKQVKNIDGKVLTTEYSYDKNGNIALMIYPSGRQINYSMVNDKVTTVIKDGVVIASGVSYNPFGGIKNVTFGNGANMAIAYDMQYQVTNISASGLQNESYTYDHNGNIKRIYEDDVPSRTKTYNYDSFDRLTNAEGPWGSVVYSYDNVGNRLKSINNGSTDYTYKPYGNQLVSASGNESNIFNYDENGNTVTEGRRRYIYNQDQRMEQVLDLAVVKNEQGQNQEAPVIRGSYVYNGIGQRVRKTVNGASVYYIYDQQGRLLTEYNENYVDYVYINGLPYAKLTNVEDYYMITDQLGTPQKMLNSQRQIVWEVQALPFGEAMSITGIAINNIRFQGQYYDEESGLNYNYFRDYNPRVGRYIQSDPVGILKGKNHLYSYVQNNPNKWIDPRGLSLLSPKCWKAAWKAKCACGDDLDKAVDDAYKFLDWCEDAYEYCFVGAAFERLKALDPKPTDEQCKILAQNNSYSTARLSCVNSPVVINMFKQGAKCGKAILDEIKECK